MRNYFQLIALAVLGACSLLAGNFLPLQTGNTWIYRDVQTGQRFTVRVGLPVFANDQVYFGLTGYTPDRVLVRIDEKGELAYLDEDRGMELPLTSFIPFEGGWWQANRRLCDQVGQTLEKRGPHDGPAGPIANVLEIRYRTFGCADAGLDSEQYAENIGMVRRVETTFAGPRVFDLVYARVGTLLIDALPHTRFSVTVDYIRGSENINVTLRLQERAGAPLTLTFPSGQEYEVVLRDSGGKALWTWSANQLFIQALHQRTVETEWSVTVAIPRQPGAYSVQAWMTTLGAVPEFSATVPLVIDGGAEFTLRRA